MSTKKVRILLLEDDNDSALMLELTLRSIGEIAVTRTATLAETLAVLKAGTFDVILTDLKVPDSVGIDTFRAIRAAAPTFPIVIHTANSNEEMALEAIAEGAQDVVVKPSTPRRIVRAILYAIIRQSAMLDGAARETASAAIDLLKEIVERLENVVTTGGACV
jgi:DNA-binding NtrC family response regulator